MARAALVHDLHQSGRNSRCHVMGVGTSEGNEQSVLSSDRANSSMWRCENAPSWAGEQRQSLEGLFVKGRADRPVGAVDGAAIVENDRPNPMTGRPVEPGRLVARNVDEQDVRERSGRELFSVGNPGGVRSFLPSSANSGFGLEYCGNPVASRFRLARQGGAAHDMSHAALGSAFDNEGDP